MRKHLDLSTQAFKRMPYYLEFLKERQRAGAAAISARIVAAYFGLSEIQVRKDLAAVSTSQGRPKLGFDLPSLIADIEEILCYRNMDEAVLMGAGALGSAFMAYGGFAQYGIKIVAAFDVDEKIIGKTIDGKPILPSGEAADYCRDHHIRIGILTVPADKAQEAAEQLISGGVLALWNFAQAHVNVPPHVLLQNENMAASLARLSQHLKEGQALQTNERKV